MLQLAGYYLLAIQNNNSIIIVSCLWSSWGGTNFPKALVNLLLLFPQGSFWETLISVWSFSSGNIVTHTIKDGVAVVKFDTPNSKVCHIVILSLLHSEWSEQSSSSYFLRRNDYDWLQLDHNALHTCRHNALQHLTSQAHLLPVFFLARKKPLIHDFIVSGNGIPGTLTKHFGCKSAAITVCVLIC